MTIRCMIWQEFYGAGEEARCFDKYESESVEKRFDYKIDGIECVKFVFEKIGYNLDQAK